MEKKYTKRDIERLAKKLVAICKRNNWTDTSFYFNDKRIRLEDDWGKNGRLKLKAIEEDDICPLDYFKYASKKHIISMAFEGYLYQRINYGKGMPESFKNLFKQYNLYWEQGNAWNLSLYPNGDIEDYEYTDYSDR